MKLQYAILYLFPSIFLSHVTLGTSTAHTTFEVPLAFAAGNQSTSIAAADLNGDGDTDLVISNIGNHTISILMNTGSGTFTTSASPSVGFRPVHVITADLDGDTDQDVAVVNQNSNSVSILRNNGSGTFSADVEFATGVGPQYVAAADLDGDGDRDLAVAIGSFVAILINNGNASFSSPTNFSVSGITMSIAIGDLDGDLDNDLVVTNGPDGDVVLLRNLGNATFAPPVAFAASANTVGITLADLDADTDLDVATANGAEISATVLFNNGSGNLGPPNPYRTGNQFTSGRSIRAADMDDDGDVDLVVVNGPPIGSGVSVLFNSGAGDFAPPLNIVPSHNGTTALPVSDVAVARFDADDRLDYAAVGNTGSFSGVVVAFNRPALALFEQPPRQFSSGDRPVFIAAADLDDDEDLDLAVINQLDQELAIHFNTGDATFSGPITYEAGLFPTCVTAGDFDGDTDIDLATADAANSTDDVLVHWNDGAGAYPTSTLIHMTVGFLANVGHLASADLDGDLDLDLVAAESGASHVAVIRNNGGVFATPVPYPAGTRPKEVQPADIDADGDIDLVVANILTSAIVLRNAGNGTFGPENFVMIGFEQFSIPVSDLDGDLDSDFAASLNSTGPAAVSINSGGSFGPATPFFAGYSLGVSRAVLADFDDDTDADLAIANSAVGNVTLMENEGAGTFTLPVTYVAGLNPISLVAGDLDGDGDLDLAVANSESDDLSILINKTTSPPTHVAISPGKLELSPNWPNPFRLSTHIRYSVGRKCAVKLTVFDVRGAHVATLVDAVMPEGSHEVRWDGRDSLGNAAAAGTYFCRFLSGNTTSSRRLVLIR